MPSTQIIVDEAEALLRRTEVELTKPREGECLCCYVVRLLDEIPCDNHLRHALHYRDVVAPRAKGLAKSLGQIGGYCDCEIFMNGYNLRRTDVDADADDAADFDEDAGFEVDDDTSEVVPPCLGGRPGSVQPCDNWVRIARH